MSNQNGFESDEEENYWLEIEAERRAEEQAEEDYYYQESIREDEDK